MSEFLAFLAAHMPLIQALIDAVRAGASRESLLATLKAAAVSASDEAMRAELDAAGHREG